MQEYWRHKSVTWQNCNERVWQVATGLGSYRQLERLPAYQSNEEAGQVELGKPRSVPVSVNFI
jgi:hypothetical protein